MRAGRRRTTNTDRRRLVVGTVIAALAVGLTVLAFASTNGVPLVESSYSVDTVLPLGAPTIDAGDAVQIAGLYAGTVASVKRAATGGQRVRMNMRVSPIGRDARITVRTQSSAGGFYLAITRGSFTSRPLAGGGAIPTARDSYTEDLPTAISGFSHAALGDLRRSLALTGAGVYHRGLGLNQAFDGAGATIADTAAVLRALTPSDDVPTFTRNAQIVAQALQGSAPDDAGRLTTAAANLFGALAAPASRLGVTVDELPSFEGEALRDLPQLDPLLTKTTVLADTLQPAVAALHTALPSVAALLRSGPILRAQVPVLASAATPALQTLTPLLSGVAPNAILLARDLPPLGTLAAYVGRFRREVLDGIGTYYYATLYHAMVGSAPGYAAAAVQLVLTCVPGYNPHPAPGSVYTDHLDKPCD